MLTEPPVRPGDVLAGKYRVDRVLGVGGMGVVVAATHLTLDEKVALKFLLPHVVQHPQAVARFLREAKAAVKIRSEHVARVTDVGTLDTGVPYIVMEYLVGSDLEERLSNHGPLSVDVAIDHVLQACEALAEAHALGIVHRDLKPANLFLTSRPDGSPLVKVLDFGIAKMGEAGSSLTATGGMMGSALYMSPEQLQSAKDVDVRTDVWSLGVVMFQLLTGQHPFMAESIGQLAVQILTQPPRNFWELRRDVPEPVVSAIASALVKDRASRCASVAELAQRLAAHGSASAALSLSRIQRLSGGPSAPLPAGFAPTAPMPQPPVETELATLPLLPQTTSGLSNVALPGAPPPVRSQRGLWLALAAVGTAGLVAGSLAFSRITDGPKASSEEVPTKPTRPSKPPESEPSSEPATAMKSTTLTPSPSVTTSVAPALATVPVAAKPKIVADTPSASSKPAPMLPDCDPPYVYDKQGIKHFKPGCE